MFACQRRCFLGVNTVAACGQEEEERPALRPQKDDRFGNLIHRAIDSRGSRLGGSRIVGFLDLNVDTGLIQGLADTFQTLAHDLLPNSRSPGPASAAFD